MPGHGQCEKDKDADNCQIFFPERAVNSSSPSFLSHDTIPYDTPLQVLRDSKCLN